MNHLINVHQLKKEYSGRILFDQISFGINSGEHIGLIGPNGAGKSTLLKILAGFEDSDSGKVAKSHGIRIAYLDQVPTFEADATIFSTIYEGTNTSLEDWERQIQCDELIALLNMGPQEEFQPAGILSDTPITELSGGWKKRIAILREWARNPDLLFMDEPTNHLDVESILWLEQSLQSASYAYVVITHDRQFLQNVCTRIMELDRRNPGGLISVVGTFADYLELKEQTMLAQEKTEDVLRNTLRREVEWLRRGPKARTTKQQARIQRAEVLQDRVSELESRNQSTRVQMGFQSTQGGPKKLIEAKSITKRRDDKVLFEDFSLTLMKGARIGLLGPNGCGKSTLIRCLLGSEPVDTGLVHLADHLQIAYFEQNRDNLKLDASLLSNVCPQGDHVKYRGNWIHIRSYLDRMGFDARKMELPVKKLSGGEQARILIAQLMLQEANVLVLDEPTNDLDVATLDLLQAELESFEGAILLVSHDRYFLDQVSTQLVAFDSFQPGNMHLFAELSQWEQWYKEQHSLGSKNQGSILKSTPGQKSPHHAHRKLPSFNTEIDDVRNPSLSKSKIEKIEKKIIKIEGEIAQLSQDLSAHCTPDIENQGAAHTGFQRLSKLQIELDGLYQEWERLTAP